jgi:hypothetical protein
MTEKQASKTRVYLALPTDSTVGFHMRVMHDMEGGHAEHENEHRTDSNTNHHHIWHQVARASAKVGK